MQSTPGPKVSEPHLDPLNGLRGGRPLQGLSAPRGAHTTRLTARVTPAAAARPAGGGQQTPPRSAPVRLALTFAPQVRGLTGSRQSLGGQRAAHVKHVALGLCSVNRPVAGSGGSGVGWGDTVSVSQSHQARHAGARPVLELAERPSLALVPALELACACAAPSGRSGDAGIPGGRSGRGQGGPEAGVSAQDREG